MQSSRIRDLRRLGLLIYLFGCHDSGTVTPPMVQASAAAGDPVGAPPVKTADPTSPRASAAGGGGTPLGVAGQPSAAAHEAGAPVLNAPARWPSYGYDAANTLNNLQERALGPKNLSQLKERWRVMVPSGATSTPVVYDGMVYFGDWTGQAYGVDADSGAIRWQRHLTDLFIRSTPLATDDRVYFAAGGSLVALDRRSGNPVFSTELSMHPEVMLDSSPKLIGDLILLGLASVENTYTKDTYSWTGAIVALDAISGSEVWRIPTSGPGPGRCTGGPGVSVWSSAAIDPDLGLAFIGTGQNYAPPSSNCSDSLVAFHYARDYAGERIAWTAQYTSGDVYAVSPSSATMGQDGDIGAAPNLFEIAGRPVVGAGDKAASYRVFDRQTGALVWKVENLGVGAFHQAGGVRTTAAVHDGTIYVASNILSQLSLIQASLTGGLLPGEGSVLHALDAATGAMRWQQMIERTVDGSFVFANGVLYHAANGLGLIARDPATGQELWRAPIALSIGAGPSVISGRIYLSAGYNVFSTDTATPNTTGGQVMSFGLDGPDTPTIVQARVDPPKMYDQASCQTAVRMASDWPAHESPSPECVSCLCSCDPTAAGNCDVCWLQAPCAVANCGLSAQGDALHTCMAISCVSKLLPSDVFERSVAIAPCANRCAQQCGWP